MKKIHNIIQSELVARTNNAKFRQEYGELGVSTNLRNEANTTIFTTEFGIEKVLFLTVNGVNLIEGVHFYVEDEFNIYISNFGDPLNVFSGQTVNVLVVYLHNNRRYSIQDIKLPPIITTFYLNRYAGVDEEIIFNFNIEKRDGKNIYWSILKDGGEIPLFSGAGLDTNNGYIIDSSGNLTKLSYQITNAEYLARVDQTMSFTLVVIYDLTEDGSQLDEKILKDQYYHMVDVPPLTGNITSVPSYISTSGSHRLDMDYSILNPSGNNYQWEITRSLNSEAETIVDSGSTVSDISGSFFEDITTTVGENSDYRYYLKVKETGDIAFSILSNDRTTVAVPLPSLDGRAGYLDEAIMNYQDGAGTWRKIGYSGTPQDLVEYNNRVPEEIFTKVVPETILDSGVYVQAPVWNPSGTILKVYFVIEVPDAWGPIRFVQPTGVVDIAAFNQISLGNGYTAYLYESFSSSVSNASDYKLERA